VEVLVVCAYRHGDPMEDVEGDEPLPRGGRRRSRPGQWRPCSAGATMWGAQHQRILEEEEETRTRMVLKQGGGAGVQLLGSWRGRRPRGAGTRRGDGAKQDAGAGISSIARENRRNSELSALAIACERETRECVCATLASDVFESAGGVNLMKIVKFKEIYSFGESLGDAIRNLC
jgi:hypothetical protein